LLLRVGSVPIVPALGCATLGFAVEALPESAVLAGLVAGVAAATGGLLALAELSLEGLLIGVACVVLGLVVAVALAFAGVVLLFGTGLRVLLIFALLLLISVAITGGLLVVLRLTAALATSSAPAQRVGVLNSLVHSLAGRLHGFILAFKGFFKSAFRAVLVAADLIHGALVFGEALQEFRVALKQLLELGQAAFAFAPFGFFVLLDDAQHVVHRQLGFAGD